MHNRIFNYLCLMMVLLIISSCVNQIIHTKEFEKIFYYGKNHGQQNGLILYGKGGREGRNIEKFIFVFEADKRLTLEESRTLVVNEVEALLNFINTDQELCSCLHEYPFSVNNFEFGIAFKDFSTEEFIEPPYIGGVVLTHGVIHYDCYYKQREPGDHYQLVQKENYQVALEIVRAKQHNSL